MADSTRPPAPFLPPEIVSQILHFVHPKPQDWSRNEATPVEFAVVSRINSSWAYQAQKRLYEKIKVVSSKQLKRLVTSIVESDQRRLGLLITSLTLSYKSTTSRSAHRVFLLLTSIPNLQNLSFSYPSFDRFSSEDERELRTTANLPNLASLSFETMKGDWDREVFDPIIGTTSVLIHVEVDHFGFQPYQGPLWTSIIPPSLKKLNVGRKLSLLAGSLWPVAQFQGLEELECLAPLNSNSIRPFFEVVGPSLKKLSTSYDVPPESVIYHLTVLEELEIERLPDDPITFLAQLSPTLTKLSFLVLPVPLPSVDSWSHLINLESMTLQYLMDETDVSLLPRLKLLRIERADLQVLITSMRSLVPGAIEVLEFGIEEIGEASVGEETDEETSGGELSENEIVRARCRELGITLKRCDLGEKLLSFL